MRTKPKNSITSREAAEAAMARLNQIDMQLAEWDLTTAKALAAVRESCEQYERSQGRPGIEAEKSLLVKELADWAEGDVANWMARSIETPFGRLGFRIGNPTVALYKAVAKKLEEALDRLSARMPDFVRMRPEIDREKILAADREGTLDRKKLLRCGLRIEQKDSFFIEPRPPQIWSVRRRR